VAGVRRHPITRCRIVRRSVHNLAGASLAKQAEPRQTCGAALLASSKPIAGSRPLASCAVSRIRKVASVDRKASASDAFREPRPEQLKLGDLLVDPFRPLARETCPVLARGNAIGRKLGKLPPDFVERKPKPLREDDEGDPT
jgi:hypothetical protein